MEKDATLLLLNTSSGGRKRHRTCTSCWYNSPSQHIWTKWQGYIKWCACFTAASSFTLRNGVASTQGSLAEITNQRFSLKYQTFRQLAAAFISGNGLHSVHMLNVWGRQLMMWCEDKNELKMNINTLRQLLVHPKDQVPQQERPGVVYRIPCTNWPRTYIGQTGWTLTRTLKNIKEQYEMPTQPPRP